MDLKGTVEHSEVTAEVLFTKGFPDYPGQSETKRRKADESFSTSLADPSTLPISVKYGRCICRTTQASFTGKGEETTSSVGGKSAESYWKWVSLLHTS